MINLNKLNKVAVYGSLKQGYSNHGLLNTVPNYTGYVNIDAVEGAGYPIMKLGLTYKLLVEVYYVDDETLSRLNDLEGYSENTPATFYDRKTVPIYGVETNKIIEHTFIYEYVNEVTHDEDSCEHYNGTNVLNWTGGDIWKY